MQYIPDVINPENIFTDQFNSVHLHKLAANKSSKSYKLMKIQVFLNSI